MKRDWLAQLNGAQRRAVEHGDGPLLIIAGAGSGKTRVLTYRIAYLLRERDVKPWQVLAVTFTNKAAAEMRERIEDLIGPFGGGLWVGTFHATCVQILRRHADRLGYKSNFVILDRADQTAAMKRVLKTLNLDPRNFDPRAILAAIGSAKNELVDPGDYERKAADFRERHIARCYRQYQSDLKANNAFDFDDLLVETVRLFDEHPDVLAEYQERFRYILVDEYQDTNRAQYVIVSRLAGGHRNLLVVGDADQSIYAFRGADIRNILEFEHDYPDAKVIKLEQNYRSTAHILRAANELIENNRERPAKALWTENPEGELIKLARLPDERREAEYVADEIERLAGSEGIGLNQVALLYRTHAQSRTFEECFMRRATPYRIVSGLRFYERKEIKDAIAYLRLIANPFDAISLERIINVPKRGIGEGTLAQLERYAAQTGLGLLDACGDAAAIAPLGPAYTKRVLEFHRLIDGLARRVESLSVTALTEAVLQESGYMHELVEEKTLEAEGRIENLREFLSVTKQYEEENGANATLDGFLEHVALISDVDAYDQSAECVTLMSLHAAKGLEFDAIFLVGMEDGVFPHSRAIWEPGELEEERRLCYVGMTRARKRLYLTCARQRTLFGQLRANDASRFLDELPREVIEDVSPERERQRAGIGSAGYALGGERYGSAERGAGARGEPAPRRGERAPGGAGERAAEQAAAATDDFAAGDKVRHDSWGEGTVVQVDRSGRDAILAIAFPSQGIKRVMVGIAPIRKLG